MESIESFLRQRTRSVLLILVVIAIISLSNEITRPLTDYDEAIYANRIISTLQSGDIFTPSLHGNPEFDKPPLYFWLAMPFVEIFGPEEWAFRMPGIVAAIFCYALIFAIVRYLTDSTTAASIGFLFLLFAPWFHFLSIEARLDSGVIAAIFAALYALLRGWRNENYLLLFFPFLAIGFLIKSIIVLLIFPTAAIYCAFYNEWRWIRSRQLWFGLLIAMVIFLPWHLYETWRFGLSFWHTYILAQLDRTISVVTGTSGFGDYIIPLISRMSLWFWSMIALLGVFFYASLSLDFRNNQGRSISAPLLCALLIFLFFSTAKTHLGSYILPAYPFLAIFVGQFFHASIAGGKKLNIAVFILGAMLIVTGAYYRFSIPVNSFQDQGKFLQDEKDIGSYYRRHADSAEQLYSLEWQGLDSLNFYSGTTTIFRSAKAREEQEFRAPFYLVMTIEYANFIHSNLPHTFDQMKAVITGEYLILFFSEQKMTVGGGP